MRPSSLRGAAYCVALCPSVCPSVPLLLPSVTSRHLANYSDTHVLFGNGRISYGHLGRTNSCLHAGCPSCHLINRVNTLKGHTQKTNDLKKIGKIFIRNTSYNEIHQIYLIWQNDCLLSAYEYWTDRHGYTQAHTMKWSHSSLQHNETRESTYRNAKFHVLKFHVMLYFNSQSVPTLRHVKKTGNW